MSMSANSADQRVICVLGMHRSGTSLVTRVLNLLGVYLGSETGLTQAKDDNPKGFWEHYDIARINDEIFSRFGGSWHEPPDLPVGWESSSELGDLRQQAQVLIRDQFSGIGLWGWKDPRNCLTLPFWQQFISDIQYVVCLRNPIDVSSSLTKRDGFLAEKGSKLWLKYVVSALRHTARGPRLLLFYEDFMERWEAQLARLSTFLGAANLATDPDVRSAVEAFTDQKLYHHRSSVLDVSNDRSLAFPSKALYMALRLAASRSSSGSSLSDHPIDAFAVHCEQAIVGLQQENLHEAILEVFWPHGNAYTKANSAMERLIVDGAPHNYCLRLPSGIRGPLRFDPCNRPAYLEISSISLLIESGTLGEPRQTLVQWSSENRFEHLTLERGLVPLPVEDNLRLICTDEDPQICLNGIPEIEEHCALTLELSLVASADTERIVVELNDELLRKGKSADDYADRLRKVTERLDTQERVISELSEIERDLSAQLRDHDYAIEVLRSEKNHEIESLTATIADKEAKIAEMEATIREREATIGEREAELNKITASLGWRLLSRYGRIKYRYLLPIYRLLRSSRHKSRSPSIQKERAAGNHQIRSRCPAPFLRPLNQLTALDETGANWQSMGCDPQFMVEGWWPKEWAKISIDIQPEDSLKGGIRLYIDRGSGFTEADGHNLGEVGCPQQAVVRLGSDVVALRLDPVDAPGRFKITRFTLTQASPAEVRSFAGKESALPRAAGGRALSASTAFKLSKTLESYAAWLEVNEWNERRADALRARIERVANLPLISIIMPVFNPPVSFLERAINSVSAQVYQNWELCIADEESTDPAARATLERLALQHPRIKLAFRKERGDISRATNSAAEMASGEFLLLMDHDDEITPDALGEVILYLSQHPETDVLYSDDDKIDTDGNRFAPQFKPDWSPELLLSYMYFSRLFVIRRSLYEKTGGLRIGFEGSQDYDLALRATELATHVGHIPKVLYHWRAVPGSTALSGGAKPVSFEVGKKSVQEALDRRGIQAEVFQSEWAVKASCGVFSLLFPDDGPSVAIIISTKNKVELLRPCVDSIRMTTYKNYQVVIIDNDDSESLSYPANSPYNVLRLQNPGDKFNFSALNNRAVEEADAEYILFLNNDTEVLTPTWLSQMVGYLGMPGVGAVGARLLFPDGRVQHAGVIHGYYGGLAGSAFKLAQASDDGYLAYARVARNYSAVTAACMLTPRDLFLRLGGFDEQSFSLAYNDVDYCYRLNDSGYRVVYCPAAELIHHEGFSRERRDDPAEPAAFRKKYRNRVDPYYNPNLSLENKRFSIDSRTIAPDDLDPIKALMCAFTLNWEGAPYSQYELTVRLKEQGIIDPIVYCPVDGPLRTAYEDSGITVEVAPHPLSGVSTIAEYEKAIRTFSERLRHWGVDLVYANTLRTFYAIAASKECDLPSVWNPRESEPWQTYFDDLGPDIAARALRCFDYPYKVVFVADATRFGYSALNAHSNFITIHNALDRSRFSGILQSWPRHSARKELKLEADEIAILLLGTVCERKGQIDLVEAIGCLNGRHTSRIRCFIVGDRPGDYSERLKSACGTLPKSMQSCIRVVPETVDVGLYYSAADIFVCTSRIESFPRVILEAMAAGLPVITTPVFGISEQVQEGVNALTYQPGETRGLAEAIEKLVTNSELRKRLGDNSKQVLDTMIDYDTMVLSYGRVFREAWLSGRSRRCVGSQV